MPGSVLCSTYMMVSRIDKTLFPRCLFQCGRNMERDDWEEKVGLDFGGGLNGEPTEAATKIEL